jgi:serine/threonine protein phosphatase PrpC/CRP-like cAMP-binding protein
MRVRFGALTDVGKTREHNEDNFLVDRKLQLFVVADGMGGHASGEVASAMAVNTMRENVLRNRDILLEYESGRGGVDRRDVLALLEHSIQHASHRIFEKGLESPRQRGMGTTLTALLIAGGRGFIGHVGDSRLYLVRDSLVHQLTEDHSLLNELIKHGKVKSLGDIDHRFKNAVTRAVGVYETVEVDTLDFDILPGDRYLLCTDGLHGYLDTEEILQRIRAGELDEVAKNFVDFANEQGGRDNITNILVEVDEGERPDSLDDVRLRFDTLRSLRLFKYLSYNELVRVLNISSERTFDPGEALFREGDLDDRLYVLLKGEVRVCKSDVEMARLKPGAHFGEMALVDQTCRSADAITPTGCSVLSIERKDFYDLLRRNSTLAVKMLWSFVKALTERLRNANSEITRLRSEMEAGDGEPSAEARAASWRYREHMSDLVAFANAAEQMSGQLSDVERGELPPELLPLAEVRPLRPKVPPLPTAARPKTTDEPSSGTTE